MSRVASTTRYLMVSPPNAPTPIQNIGKQMSALVAHAKICTIVSMDAVKVGFAQLIAHRAVVHLGQRKMYVKVKNAHTMINVGLGAAMRGRAVAATAEINALTTSHGKPN